MHTVTCISSAITQPIPNVSQWNCRGMAPWYKGVHGASFIHMTGMRVGFMHPHLTHSIGEIRDNTRNWHFSENTGTTHDTTYRLGSIRVLHKFWMFSVMNLIIWHMTAGTRQGIAFFIIQHRWMGNDYRRIVLLWCYEVMLSMVSTRYQISIASSIAYAHCMPKWMNNNTVNVLINAQGFY